jgi:hypothetical protein
MFDSRSGIRTGHDQHATLPALQDRPLRHPRHPEEAASAIGAAASEGGGKRQVCARPLMPPRRISFADLMETARMLPQEVRDDKNRLTFTMAVSVIRHFFGQQWCENHIIQDAAHSRPAGLLRLDFTPGYEGEKKTSRVLDFAETLFNLQNIKGFDERVDQMRAGGSRPRHR